MIWLILIKKPKLQHPENTIPMSKKKDIKRIKTSFGKLKDDNFNFELIEKYFKNKDNSDSFQVLSDKTCNFIKWVKFKDELQNHVIFLLIFEN